MKTLAKKVTTLASRAFTKFATNLEYVLFAVILLAFASIFVSAGQPSKTYPTKDKELASTSVKIVRLDGRSGGSGVILKSTKTVSYVLTNSHVCGVVEKGGLVVTDRDSRAVTSYKKSQNHDLCLLTVAGDLGVNTEVASSAPESYTPAVAVGHPKLLPTIVTRGHFTGRQMISVMIGSRPCTDKDLEDDPDNALLCMFLGGIPLVKTYETQIASLLISPGSSGSPVFDEQGMIAGLVFAGSGDISQAFLVPQEAVFNFVYQEAPGMSAIRPNYLIEVTAKTLKGQSQSYSELSEKIEELCSKEDAKENKAVQNLCEMHKRDLLWRN